MQSSPQVATGYPPSFADDAAEHERDVGGRSPRRRMKYGNQSRPNGT